MRGRSRRVSPVPVPVLALAPARVAVVLLLMSAHGAVIPAGAAQAPSPAPGRPAAPARPVAPAPAPVLTARQMAPVDLTGTWVSVVSEDWAWRMFTPPKGDYASVPLNPTGRKLADGWMPEQAGSCNAYGAAALLRMPGRVRISWQDDYTLKIETDAGQQTRLLRFSGALTSSTPASGPLSIPASTPSATTPSQASVAPAARTLQGQSAAAWLTNGPVGQPLPTWASLRVITTQMRAAWLRPNGVPYSEAAVLTEHFDHFAEGADQWFTVSTLVEDPAYLTMPFVISSNFKKEPDGSKWSPATCKAN